MPLNVALDMARRLRAELADMATPEQQRDFDRLERLITEAQQRHQQELQAARAPVALQPQGPAEAPSRSFWRRWRLGSSG